MNGAIELPGETNPLTEQTLMNTLRSAASNDPLQIQTGTKQLQKWETEQGFYGLLQDVFIQPTVPMELRMLAIIQLKNGVEKYWRKSATNAIRPEERAKIRSRLLSASIVEGNMQLVSINSLVVAKVARFDFPLQWPGLIKEITEILQNSLGMEIRLQQLPQALLTLLHIIKELATIRIQRSKASLLQVAPDLLRVLSGIYLEKVEQWKLVHLNSSAPFDSVIQSTMNESLLTLRIIRRLILAGFEFPSKDSDVQHFWETTTVHMNLCLNVCSMGVANDSQLLALKHVIQFAKLHLDIAKTHPTSFAFLPCTLTLVRGDWAYASMLRTQLGSPNQMSEDVKSNLEKLILLSLRILRACIKLVFSPPPQSFKYRHSDDREEPDKARELFRQELLTDSFVNEIMETLITKFFMFIPGDLEEWLDEPEEWELNNESEEDAYELSIRPCSERLFLDITVHYRQLIMQPLLTAFSNLTSPIYQDVLVKDAIYSAIGLAALTLHEHVDFDAFLTTTIVAELQKEQPRSNVIRRRIAILLAQWVSVKISQANRPLVYQIYGHLLDKTDDSNDVVVRVTAGKRFKDVVNEWEFQAEQFEPFGADIMSRLMALVEEVDMVETKLALLNTISALVERMGDKISPFAGNIVALLPPLWEQSGDQHMMKQAILVTLERLIKSLKAGSAPLQDMVLPIIEGALQPDSDTQVYLLEDALELWEAVVVHAKQPASPRVLSVLPFLFPIFELGSENLLKALEITKSYLLLAPAAMLNGETRVKLLSTFTALLDILKPNMIHLLTELVELMIRYAENLGGQQAVKITVEGLMDAGFLTKLITGIKGNWQASGTTGPHRKDPVIETTSETKYFIILARMILSEGGTKLFRKVIEIYNEDYGEHEAQAMKWLLAEWFNHMDYVSVPTDSKLLCLALTKLMECGQPWILDKLQDLMTVWTSVVSELQDGDDEDRKGSDSLVFHNHAEMRAQDSGVPEERRSLEISMTDPVHSINTVAYIKHHLIEAVQGCGGEQAFQEQWLVNVDKDVIKAFGTLGIM